MPLLFEEKVTQNKAQFIAAVNKLASRYNANPNWFMAVFNSETGGTFSPSIYNQGGSGAVGLIQFMPSTAKALGTTTSYLSTLSNVEQLAWVQKYLDAQLKALVKWIIYDYDDLYFLIFYPAAVGKPDDYVIPLTKLGYEQNKGIDMNKDGKITVADFKKFIMKNIPAKEVPTLTENIFQYNYKALIFITLGLILLALGLFWAFRVD